MTGTHALLHQGWLMQSLFKRDTIIFFSCKHPNNNEGSKRLVMKGVDRVWHKLSREILGSI